MGSIGELVIYVMLFALLYFQVFLLLAFFDRRKSINSPKTLPLKFPSVTIIVPCFNEESTLSRTVTSLLDLDYPKDKLKIFLINDGSTDKTHDVMMKYSLGFPQIKVFDRENSGKFQTLNFGIRNASSDYVGCLDADSFVDRNALKEIVSYFNSHPKIMAVTPSIRIHSPDTVIRMVQNAEYDLGVTIRKILSLIGAIHITPGPFSIFKREVFKTIGEYKHAHNTEDLEIALRMQKAGMRIDNAHKAIVYTVGPSNLRTLYKQRVRWTVGFFRNMIDYKSMLFNKQYGILGTFIMPMILVSIVCSLYFIILGIWSFCKDSFDTFNDLKLINFDVNWLAMLPQGFGIEWFFVNAGTLQMITLLLMCSTLFLIISGRFLTGQKKIFSLDIVVFSLLYGFLVPLWLMKSAYNTVLAKETSWR